MKRMKMMMLNKCFYKFLQNKKNNQAMSPTRSSFKIIASTQILIELRELTAGMLNFYV
jgi:hypothetical protein